jgi:peptidoglycan/LPS O-acetylase OafA/YrhL
VIRRPVQWRRNAVIAVVLAALILVLQLVAGNPFLIALLSAVVAVVVALGVLAVADRFSRR